MLPRTKRKEKLAAVPQQHPLGCGVACVAFRCGISYPEALSLFAHAEHAWTRGFYCSEIVAALANAGLEYSFTKMNSSRVIENKIVDGAIVFIGVCGQYPAGHYLIRTNSGWMNPWSNFPLMNKVHAEIQDELPAKIDYVIFETGKSATGQCQISASSKFRNRR